MSHDGSSGKSYIRHTTEKERLDNLAFTSFPEDYLPYAAANHGQQQNRPPYLLWGDDNRRRRPAAKRRRSHKCAGALLCAIALVVVAILAVVAISVYLGVVTNLFRSPVVSLSGRFTASDEFSEELLNSSSSQFLEKVNTYQSKVEKAFLSSSLEPAFIAARIHSFRPGLVIFFRVYLDRRKISVSEEESPPSELVRELVVQKLAHDPDSVHVEESDNATEAPPIIQRASESSSPKSTIQPPSHPRAPAVGGVGLWKPVPIEDSVSPSFVNRPPGGTEVVRLPVDSARSQPEAAQEPKQLSKENEGVGSVRILDESRLRSPSSSPRLEGVATVRLLEDIAPESSVLSENTPPQGVGSQRLPNKAAQKPPLVLPANAGEGIGTVRLLDETPPKRTTQQNSRTGIGLVRTSEENPVKKKQPAHRYLNEGVYSGETPPTLAPSVSLVIRNRSRSDKTRNFGTSRLDKPLNTDKIETESIGVGSVREIITDLDNFPLHASIESSESSSRLLNPDSNTTSTTATVTTEAEPDPLVTEVSLEKGAREAIILDDLVLHSSTGDLKNQKLLHEENISETESTTFYNISTSSVYTPIQETRQETTTFRLESLFFNLTQNVAFTTAYNNYVDDVRTEESNIPILSEDITENSDINGTLDSAIITMLTTTNEPEVATEPQVSTLLKEELNEKEIHLSLVNQSQYPNPDPHYHTIEKDNNMSSIDSLELHTLSGHGFHMPPSLNETSPQVSSHLPPPTTTNEFVSEEESSTQQHQRTQESTTAFTIIMDIQDSSETDEELERLFTPENLKYYKNDSFDSEERNSNITTEDNSQQPKVVPQLESEFLSNDIGNEEESGDDEDDRFEGEIFRHITTVRPQQNGSNFSSCPVGLVPCSISGEGCGVRCDMRRDCPDSEDEHGCSCSDLLRTMGQTHKLCDGVNDCDDGSDETDCPWCPAPDHFKCPSSRTCIPLERVCDGREDCPGKQDESRCVTLADSSVSANSSEYRSKGYLLIRRNGRWGKLCLDALAHNSDLDRRTKELGRAVCTTLTYRNMSSSIRTRDKTESEVSYFQISSENKSSIFELSPCKGKEVLRVECQSLECGLRPSAPPAQRRRIVGGRSVEGTGAWPWAAALYREGDFQCGAALINDIWLISAAHCFYSSLGAHWIARMGMLRRGLELASIGEQVRRIQQFILHPQYEDTGFINDIALLRMDRPVPFSDLLRPICLPSSPEEDASLWHGRRCSVVGWGKLFEIGHTFPDTLQEVRLPVISSIECQRRSLFLPAYRITPNMFCAGYERGGRDACLGDSGGPMACQRPADSRWVLLGVTSNGDGCGRPNRPGVYTQVASYLPWILDITSNQKVFHVKSESNCTGGSIRCRLGRCIPLIRVCDGRRDCASGEDEENCQ